MVSQPTTVVQGETEKESRLTVNGQEIMVSETHIRRAISHSVYTIIEAIKATIEETPPELVADIMNRGITLAGGGSLLRNLDKLIAQETLMPVQVTEDPLTAVVRGTGIVLENIDELHEILVSADNAAIPL